jgi:putative membrane protein
MRAPIGVLTVAALSIAFVGACSKPAENTVDATAASADAAASSAAAGAGDAAGGVTAPGGAVSPPPANGNEAVNTDGNTTEASQSPASNSFTESQARGHIEKAGYSEVTGLTKTPEGLWTGKAKKDGKTTNVSVDFKGAVTAQ